MKVPSVLWIAVVLILPPMLVPFLDRFWPQANYWWSALLIVVLNALVLVVKAVWFKEAAEVIVPNAVPSMGPSASTPSFAGPSGATSAPAATVVAKPQHGLAAKVFLYGV